MLCWLNDDARGQVACPHSMHQPTQNLKLLLTLVNQVSHQTLNHCIIAPGCNYQLGVSLEMSVEAKSFVLLLKLALATLTCRPVKLPLRILHTGTEQCN